ncbi:MULTISPECIES: hypothetical protein [unclassified Streptomyces]|uniref:phage tail termination protein n=1 Tax=unclassified Streptomyces TaxID=2593676 RepID=UPI00331B0B51
MNQVPNKFPDVQKIVVDLLTQSLSATAGVTVVESPPVGFNGTTKTVVVSRRGGAWIDDLHLDQPLIELEVYGPTKSDAHVLANDARAALLGMAGRVIDTSVPKTTITDVSEADGPRWLPDYVYTAANRYLCILRLFLRTD